jgi:STE24 endopeptidase
MTARVMFVLLALIVLCAGFQPVSAQPDSSKTSSTATATLSPDSVVYPPSPARLAKQTAYARFGNIWRFADFFISIAVFLIILFTGLSARLRDIASAMKRDFLKWWLYLALLLVVMYILSFPANVYRNFMVEDQYGFMNQTFWQWWGEDLLSLLLSMIFGIIPVAGLYFVVSRFRRWWLVFSICAVPIAAFFMVVAPVFIAPLYNKYDSLTDKSLETKILALADKAGIPGSHVFEVNASKQSTKVNAYVTGLFNTKRIVLYDTLIKGFTTDEILFVMGHEMGHYVMNHVWIGLAVLLVFLCFLLWLINRFIHDLIHRWRRNFGFERIQDVASLPLLMLCLTVIMFFAQPVTNTVSRAMEHSADKFGMNISQVSGDVAASAFDKLSVYNMSDPDPSSLVEFWFYDHPAIKKRIEFVRSYRP